MCGFVGFVGNADDFVIKKLQVQSDRLVHRGPDSSGCWLADDRRAAFFHRRLSILDISSANSQPFVSNCGNVILIFNGEIYNFIELKQKLIGQGITFRTNGDTEVLLEAYLMWGFNCLEHLNGMFSFAFWDRRKGHNNETLFFARDIVGEKPFYYKHTSKSFEFASELKAIASSENVDPMALNFYFSRGFIPGDMCIAKGISKLPPAHAGTFEVKSQKCNIWKYWQPPQFSNGSVGQSAPDLAEECWGLLKDAVKLRLRSDVPTGVFLSGGLDSSLITAAASDVNDGVLRTFTVGVPGSELDETYYAKNVSDYFQTDHHLLSLNNSPLSVLDELGDFIDEPIADSSIIPTYLVCKLTKKHVKVALGGDGGDELFGGYQHYQNVCKFESLDKIIPTTVLSPLSKLAATLPPGVKGRNFIVSLQHGLTKSNICGTPYFDPWLRKKLFHANFFEHLKEDHLTPEQNELSALHQSENLVDSFTKMDFLNRLPDQYLVKVDRASMANSLEVRVPFLDKNLIEFTFKNISGSLKCDRYERRKIQNIMAKKYLPKNFGLNRKQGFSLPLDDWFKHISLDYLTSNIPEKIINRDFTQKLIDGQKVGRSNTSRLFAILMLNLSFRNMNFKPPN